MPSIESEHEILSERVLAASRETVFEAFADPAVLARWWGPQGSVNLFEIFEFRAAGRWEFVMHAADGTEYPMRNRFLEVSAPERIVVEHLQADHQFQLHMTLDALESGRTRLRWRMRFESAAEAARVRTFVEEANEQNFDRLEWVLRGDDQSTHNPAKNVPRR
jgi:uncharacterized protein YndB with AHSA1/START domain